MLYKGQFWIARSTEANMADTPKSNAMYAIPDDADASTYRFIIVAAKRARQLQNGQRSVLPAANKKPTVLAMEEVRRGLVPYSDLNREDEAVPAE
jgi:DNA-directed RNA polymerase subunit omega